MCFLSLNLNPSDSIALVFFCSHKKNVRFSRLAVRAARFTRTKGRQPFMLSRALFHRERCCLVSAAQNHALSSCSCWADGLIIDHAWHGYHWLGTESATASDTQRLCGWRVVLLMSSIWCHLLTYCPSAAHLTGHGVGAGGGGFGNTHRTAVTHETTYAYTGTGHTYHALEVRHSNA